LSKWQACRILHGPGGAGGRLYTPAPYPSPQGGGITAIGNSGLKRYLSVVLLARAANGDDRVGHAFDGDRTLFLEAVGVDQPYDALARIGDG
jgi:hypothetical protein